jgi:Extensin-like protein C-terminus
MATQPDNYFETLAGVPVLYDRLKKEHYGTTGIPYKFHCTKGAQTTLEALFEDLFARTVPRFGPVSAILSAGAWVNKPGQHGEGKAFDLDAILWQRIHFIALEQPQKKTLYLAVQALCNKHFGVVLGYNYNVDHRDHLHVDISRSIAFREAKSVAEFLQETLNTLYNQTLTVDGEYGPLTAQALSDTLAVIGIPNVDTADNWKRFLEAVCSEAVSRVADAIDADTRLASGMTVGAESVHSDLILEVGADPTLAHAHEPHTTAPAPYLLAPRPDTGRIDLNYKPFQTWSVYPKKVGNQEQWYADFDNTQQFYLGYEFVFGNSGYTGLARTGSSKAINIDYDHEAYLASFGAWASFIYPTGRCESEAKFLVVNAWDAAAMTLGFFQNAAHTGEHLANLFRELIDALPDEADQFFPELKLGKQINHSDKMRLFAVNGAAKLDLDQPARPSDNLPAESWYRGHFMGFFNPDRGRLDQEEAVSAARWIAWLMTSAKAREVCVRNAVNTAKTSVKRVHKYVGDQHHTKYPRGLDGVPMNLVAAAMDVKHHGRRNRDVGQSTDQSIFSALTASEPWAAFEKIDTDWRENRSRRSVKEIRAMKQWFDGKVYDATAENFR